MASYILIVEDDDDIRVALAEMLALKGYQVRAAANGAEALEALHAEPPPSLIVLDLMMPVMDGWQLRIEMLKEQALTEIPIIVISGAAGAQTAARALGAVGCLTKPFKFQPLLELVQHHAPAPK
jgi:CheY-like chemotaxis protein